MRLALSLVFACLASAAYPLTTKLYPELALRGGEATPVPDTGITLLLTDITDGRCPPEADCTWEGMIRAEITVTTPDTPPQTIILCNLCEDGTSIVTAAGQTLALIGLTPSTEELARLGRAPRLTDYTLTVSYAPAGP
ncbi:MAG: hypothetical protein JNK19_17910 [Tabrizicola sp.]|nr:hypothetical protein [Tabrizicola sp.]